MSDQQAATATPGRLVDQRSPFLSYRPATLRCHTRNMSAVVANFDNTRHVVQPTQFVLGNLGQVRLGQVLRDPALQRRHIQTQRPETAPCSDAIGQGLDEVERMRAGPDPDHVAWRDGQHINSLAGQRFDIEVAIYRLCHCPSSPARDWARLCSSWSSSAVNSSPVAILTAAIGMTRRSRVVSHSATGCHRRAGMRVDVGRPNDLGYLVQVTGQRSHCAGSCRRPRWKRPRACARRSRPAAAPASPCSPHG